MKRIDKLTPEQVARMPEWTKKWVDIGLSTEPADFDTATEAALKAYALCNLKKPMVILRMGSPYAATVGGALAWSILRSIDGVRAQVGAQVGAQIRAQVWDQVRDQVRAQVGAQVWAQVWAQVQDQVQDQVWAQVGAQVGVQVWDQVGDQSLQAAKDGLNNDGASNLYWSAFAAWVSFFRDVCGWESEILKKFEISEALVKSCGWTWWHENVLAISDRPSMINRDQQGRLHSEAGSSIAYRDGWSLYHWHGVSVPAHWIEKRAELDPNEVIAAQNTEQRAAGAAICGWTKMLSVLKSKTINDSGSDDIGQLIELTLPGLNEPGRFLKAVCPRNGIICEGVPRVSDVDGLPIETALAAQAWRIGDPQSEYQHPSRRT